MKSSSVDQLRNYLRKSLGPMRPEFRWEMTPEMAYGRHRGPARIRSRQAAVAVVLLHDESHGWTVPLTRRPTTLRHHGGQICFPGGRIEAHESSETAALREFCEELGVNLGAVNSCGELPQQYVYASDNQVTPLVFVCERPRLDWQPDPVEVDEVIEMPLSSIIAEPVIESTSQNRRIRLANGLPKSNQIGQRDPEGSVAITNFRFQAPAYSYENYRIWGATAVILHQLAQCLLSLKKVPIEDL